MLSLRSQLQALLDAGARAVVASGEYQFQVPAPVPVERARANQGCDFASPVALAVAKTAKAKPRDLATAIVQHLPECAAVSSIEIAGPGFINITLAPSAYQCVVTEILDAGDAYGRSRIGQGQPIQVEFVSATPTGPLHVGHGRGAACGAVIANLLDAIGCRVQREYYVNDAGRQMYILAASVYVRYLEVCGETLRLPEAGYRGDYIRDMAQALKTEEGEALRLDPHVLVAGLPPDHDQGGDKERYVDAFIARVQEGLGEDRFSRLFQFGREFLLTEIKSDLEEFGVTFDRWYPESRLWEGGHIHRAVAELDERGQIYEKEGARWFRSTEHGDDKDRVVVREDGRPTYFAADIAYHKEKFERGFERVIDVWGADHHGYIARVKGSVAAFGYAPEHFEVVVVQFVNLFRGTEKAYMSTRAGDFVTLRELREEVGNDAARFFYVLRKSEQHLDFDLELAKSRSSDNPVYYVQYAHARVASVVREARERGPDPQAANAETLARLTQSHERELMKILSQYPEVVEMAALAREPHQLAFYLRDLANAFHTCYASHRILVDDSELRDARLALAQAASQVVANGLALIGVSAPQHM